MFIPDLKHNGFIDFSFVNRKRCEAANGYNHKLEEWSSSDWMTAVVGEVGEAANIVKKLNRWRDGVPGNTKSVEELRRELRKELADVFVYLDLMAQAEGFHLEDAVREVFNAKSEKIGYPERI